MRSPITWVIILGAAVIGGGYLLYRRSKAAAASSSSTTGATTGTSTGDSTDYSGQIATLQTEIEDLQSSGAQDSSGTGTTGTSTGTGTSGTGTGSTGSTGSTGTKTPPAKATAKAPGMPTSVVGAAAGTSSVKVSWGKVTGATSYQVRATYQSKLAGSATVTSTSATIAGLTPNHTYTVHVKACNAAGCSSETNGPVIHTPKAA
jgi:hypothetical protein